MRVLQRPLPPPDYDAAPVDRVEVKDSVRVALRDLAAARPGRRSVAASALWLAATGATEPSPSATDPLEAFRVYRVIAHDVRSDMTIIVGRALDNEPDPAVRRLLLLMLMRFAELEVFVVAPPLARRRVARAA